MGHQRHILGPTASWLPLCAYEAGHQLERLDDDESAQILLFQQGKVIAFWHVIISYRYAHKIPSRIFCKPNFSKVYYGLERSIKSADATARDYKDRRKEIDNPDQRIQEDVASFTSLSLTFFLTIISTVIDLVSFSIILFSILPKLFVAIIRKWF